MTPTRATATLLSCVDGTHAGKLGTQQPPTKGDVHTLDLTNARALTIDVDGSVIFLKEHRLVRCSRDGAAAPIWPPHKRFFGLMTAVADTSPFTGESVGAPGISDVDDYADKIEDARLHVGRDGALYVWESKHVVCFDRTGRRLWGVMLPDAVSDVAADASGNAYVVSGYDDGASIARVTSGGAVRAFVGAEQIGGTIPSTLVVRRDGRIVALGDDRRMLALSADGDVLWQNRGTYDD